MPTIDNTVNGSIAGNGGIVLLDVERHSVATVTLTGTWAGTVQFEATTDNLTWVAVPAVPVPSGATVTSATANGTWSVNVYAFATLRLRASAWTSGALAVAVRATAAGGTVPVLAPGSIPFADASGRLASSANYTINPTTGALTFMDESGTSQSLYTAWSPTKVEVTDGTAGAPRATVGPTVKLSRTESFASVLGASNVDNESNATLAVYSVGSATTQQQTAAIFGASANSSAVGGIDAVGGYFVGRVTGAGTGIGTGIFAAGRREASTGKAKGAELNASDYSGVDAAYSPSGLSAVTGLWVSYKGNPGSKSGVGVALGIFPSAGQFAVGYGVTAGAVGDAAFRDDSSATTSYLIQGTHTFGVDLAGSTTTVGLRMNSQGILQWRNAAGNANLNMFTVGGTDTLTIYGVQTINSGGTTSFSGLVNANGGIGATAGTTTGLALSPTLTPGASDADGIAIGGGVVATGTTSFGNYYNAHVKAATKTGSGVITTAYGMTIENPTIGATNVAAWIKGTAKVDTDVQVNGKTLNFYDFGGGFIAKPSSGAVDMPIPITRALTIPANMAGSQAIAKTGATLSAAFTIAKVSGGVTTTIGTLTFASAGQGGAQTGAFTTPAGAAQTLAAGDYVLVTAPTQDATLADVSYALTGTWY